MTEENLRVRESDNGALEAEREKTLDAVAGNAGAKPAELEKFSLLKFLEERKPFCFLSLWLWMIACPMVLIGAKIDIGQFDPEIFMLICCVPVLYIPGWLGGKKTLWLFGRIGAGLLYFPIMLGGLLAMVCADSCFKGLANGNITDGLSNFAILFLSSTILTLALVADAYSDTIKSKWKSSRLGKGANAFFQKYF